MGRPPSPLPSLQHPDRSGARNQAALAQEQEQQQQEEDQQPSQHDQEHEKEHEHEQEQQRQWQTAHRGSSLVFTGDGDVSQLVLSSSSSSGEEDEMEVRATGHTCGMLGMKRNRPRPPFINLFMHLITLDLICAICPASLARRACT